VEKVVPDGVNHLPRRLRAAGAIEENGWLSVHMLGEGGEVGTDPRDIKIWHSGDRDWLCPGSGRISRVASGKGHSPSVMTAPETGNREKLEDRQARS
jgi:hypothetical protein